VPFVSWTRTIPCYVVDEKLAVKTPAPSTSPQSTSSLTLGSSTTSSAPPLVGSPQLGIDAKIALGVGIGIGVPALIIAVLTWRFPQRALPLTRPPYRHHNAS
jgi:hypothetical protein